MRASTVSSLNSTDASGRTTPDLRAALALKVGAAGCAISARTDPLRTPSTSLVLFSHQNESPPSEPLVLADAPRPPSGQNRYTEWPNQPYRTDQISFLSTGCESQAVPFTRSTYAPSSVFFRLAARSAAACHAQADDARRLSSRMAVRRFLVQIHLKRNAARQRLARLLQRRFTNNLAQPPVLAHG